MKEQFCSYEISLKLKELGFDEECLGLFKEDKSFFFCDVFAFRESYTESEFKDNLCCDLYYKNSIILDNLVSAPIWQQAEQWFRDTHNYHIAVYRLNNKWCGEVYDILRQCYITSNAFDGVLYDTYEEAREQAILKAIELCQNKK